MFACRPASVCVCMYVNVCTCVSACQSVHQQRARASARRPRGPGRLSGPLGSREAAFPQSGGLSGEIGQEEMEDQGFTGLFMEA